MNIDIDKLSFRIKIKDEGKTKAIIAIDFGEFVIKGFRISESKFENKNGEALWINAPSYNTGNKFHPMFFMPNKELWLQIEDRIWPAYKAELEKYYKKKFDIGNDDEINPFS